jgi:outer membrane biogenesis lipoprotein LolB
MKGKQWLGLLAPLLLTSCSLPGANRSAQDEAARKAAEQASQQQLEQKMAAQALKQLQQQARTAGMVAGHQATVNCLRSERGQTDGSELRCEAWGYVQANYPEPQP